MLEDAVRRTWHTTSSDGNNQVAIDFSASFVLSQGSKSLYWPSFCAHCLTNWKQYKNINITKRISQLNGEINQEKLNE